MLSEGRIEDGFKELDKLGWIKQAPDSERYQQLTDAYLAGCCRKARRTESMKSVLVVSPTHAEGDRITHAIREGLKAQGKLGKERIVNA